MTSNQDILAFLKADQEDRAREKDVDKETRAKERQEDREHIIELIKVGVQKEVKAAVREVEERLVQQEIVNQELTSQINSVVRDMELLRESVKKQQAFPSLPIPGKVGEGLLNEFCRSSDGVTNSMENNAVASGRRSTEDSRVEEMCALGRRIVGFTPIEPRMLELQIQSYGARNMDEAMMMEIRSYLKCEMKILPSEIDKLDIVKIFHPAKDNWNVLYVEFGNEYQVDKLFSYTRGMIKEDHRLVRWFPKQMFDRYRAVESIAYSLRKNHGQKTRVKIGRADIELSSRDPRSTFWRRQVLPGNIPQFDFDSSFRSSVTSPPPGRPDRTQTGQNVAAEVIRNLEEEI